MFNFHLFISYSTFQFITNLHCIKHFLKFFFFWYDGIKCNNFLSAFIITMTHSQIFKFKTRVNFFSLCLWKLKQARALVHRPIGHLSVLSFLSHSDQNNDFIRKWAAWLGQATKPKRYSEDTGPSYSFQSNIE